MKIAKMLRLAVASLFFIVLAAPIVGAQSQVPGGQLLIFGQAQAYDVLLRGNGEAIVNARLTITNTEDPPLSQLKYQISGATLTEATAFQEVNQAECYSKTTQPAGNTTPNANSPLPASPAAPSSSSAQLVQPINGCIDPQQVNQYSSYSYPYQQKVYKKAEVSHAAQDATITLPSPIATNQSATIVFAYAASGYTKHRLGSYQFAFQTLKSDSRTNSVTVAVTVDEGYQLAHADSSVNYRSSATAQNLPSVLASASSLSADSSAKISNYIQGIGTNGQIVRNASQLAAHETLTVKGAYGVSWWRLHIVGLMEWFIILMVLIAATAWFVIVKRRKNRDKPKVGNKSEEPAALKESISKTEANSVESTPERTANQRWWHSLPFAGITKKFYRQVAERRVRPLFIGIFCGVLIILLMVAGYGVAWQLSNVQAYGSYNTTIWAILSVIVSILAGILLFGVIGFGLPILYGHNKGVKTVIKILVYEALFFLVILIILSCLAFMFRDTSSAPTPYNNCGGISSGISCSQPQ